LFSRLGNLEPDSNTDGEPEPVPIDLDADALTMWAAYVNRHGQEQLEHTGTLASIWSKLEAVSARLALIVHLIRASLNPSMQHIDVESVRAGIALSDWFGGEAVRLFGMMTESGEDQARRTLIEWIRARGGMVTVRDLTKGPRRFRGDTEAAESELQRLADAGLGGWAVVSTGKRQRREFRLAPLAPAPLSPESAGIRQNAAGATGATSENAKSDDAIDAANRAAEEAFADNQEGEVWIL